MSLFIARMQTTRGGRGEGEKEMPVKRERI
jgi:hypothetical protein